MTDTIPNKPDDRARRPEGLIGQTVSENGRINRPTPGTQDGPRALEPVTLFFASDEKYAPYLSVALVSIVAHANPRRRYHIIVLSNQITDESKKKLLTVTAADDNVDLDIVEMGEKIIDAVKDDKNVLNEDAVTYAIYFRLFIAELFPELDRALYLDADIVLERDVADLYDTDLHGNALGAAVDSFVATEPLLNTYARRVPGVDPNKYVNSGVMLMDLAQWRSLHAAQRFVELMNRYHVRSVCSDQDYINAMFEGRIEVLDPHWDVMTAGGLTPPDVRWLIHYNLIGKPWFYPGAVMADVFWKYAQDSPFLPRIEQVRDEAASRNMPELDRKKKTKLIGHARDFSELPLTFRSLKEQGVAVRL